MAKRIRQYHKKDIQAKESINDIKFCMRKKDWENAMVKIDDYLSIYPTDHYVMILKAMTLSRLDKKEESMKLYEEILSYKLTLRNELFVRMQYAHSLLVMENFEQAIEYYNSVIEKSSDLELIARGKLSSIYCNMKEYDRAMDILEIDGYNDTFLNNKRALVYEFMEKPYKALSVLNKKTYNTIHYEQKEKLDKVYLDQERNFIIGNAYYKINRLDDAQLYLSKVNLLNSKLYFEANLRLIKILLMIGKLDEAIILSNDIIKKSTSNSYINTFNTFKAYAYLRKNDYKKAEEIFKGLEATPEEKLLFFGEIELLKGNFEQAEENFSHFDIEKEDINEKYDEFYRLALIKFRLGKYEEAERIINKFEELVNKEYLSNIMYEVKRLKTYIQNAQGIDVCDENLGYSEKQIIHYDAESAIEHIMDHHFDNPRLSKFNDNIDIKQLFVDIKNMLNKNNVVYDSIFDNYIIKYPNVGYDLKGGNIHEMRVLVLPNTMDIITMYPYAGTESTFFIDDEEVNEKPKTKRLTQIEKFYNKYGKKT